MKKNYKNYVLPIFVIVILCGISVSVLAQNVKPQSTIVNINAKAKPLLTLFKDIETQTGYKFNYDSNEINVNQRVTLSSKNSLKLTLDALSTMLNLDFGFSGSNISVRKAEKRNAPSVKLISGLVLNKGLPLPGVNIFKKGTKQGAVTNGDGQFTLRLSGENLENTVLEFIYIGMKSKEVRLGNQTYLSVDLEDDVFGMNEVVVTGSYTKEKRREDVVGSITQISGEKLQTDRPIESFDKMLEGLVAGVQVETTTELNTPVRINIRGQGSLPSFGISKGTSSQPLFVVDGVPIYEQQRGNESSVFNGEDYLNPLSNINPDDIKSISILKDATASALYGANGANGVVIITTKNGEAGKTNVNLSYDSGVATFINEYQWLTGPEYHSLLREAYINGKNTSVTDATRLAGSNTTNTDWFDLTQRNAVYQNAGLDISGGANKTTFRVSAGYRNQEASSFKNDLQKFYTRLRLDHEFNDKFKVGLNISPTITKSNALSNYGAVLLPPNLAPYTDGTFTDFLGVPNPLAVLEQNENSNKGVQFIANLNASYKVNNEISISGTFGADSYQNKQTQYLSALNATGRTANGNLRIYDRTYMSYIGFMQATYDKTIKNHNINFLIGTQVEDNETNLLRGGGTGFTFDRLRVLSAAGNQSSASSNSESATVSYYSQLGYNFNKKYYANFNARIDKSSIFGGDKQVAFNGSVGLAYIISKEDFLKDSKTLTFLRVRTTYGSTGNSRIGNYSAKGLYDFGTASGNTYNGNVAANPDGTAAPNPDLGWEKNYKLNFGLDFNLFNKVQVTAEYYNNTIKDLISAVIVPLETGFSTISANTSKMRNKGFELSINTTAISRKNFSWNIAFNLGTNKNKLISFNNGFASLYGSRDDATALKEGNSTTAIYGYRWAGVNAQTGTEQFYDETGAIRTASQINALPLSSTSVLGDRLPDFQGGFFNNLDIYDFNFSFNILYSYGASKLVSYVDESDGRNLQNRNQSADLLDRWQKPGDITNIPQLLINRVIVSNSSRYLYDVSYLKLGNVALTYKLKESLASRLKLQRVSVFTNATNLFYVYKDAGTKGRNGIAERRFVYPETMAITAGIKVGL
ncbi:MAG: SusC/RagA family TonB-linked outer membrane protein [Bacteroidota bacterium]